MLGLALWLGACGGKTKTVTVAAPPRTTTSPSAPIGPAASGKPLASAQSTWNDYPVRLDVMSLRRSGTLVSLTVRLTNTKPAQSGDQGFFVQSLFGRKHSGVVASAADDTMDGVVLVDTANAKKYPVARDVHHACICDTGLSGTQVGDGQSVELSASFAAPPTSVTDISVLVPHFGTIHGVPIG